MHHGARGHRALVAAALALPEVAPVLDADLTASAARTAVAVGPTRGEQVVPAGVVVGEAALKVDDRSREAGASHPPTVGQAPDGPNRIVTWGAMDPKTFHSSRDWSRGVPI